MTLGINAGAQVTQKRLNTPVSMSTYSISQTTDSETAADMFLFMSGEFSRSRYLFSVDGEPLVVSMFWGLSPAGCTNALATFTVSEGSDHQLELVEFYPFVLVRVAADNEGDAGTLSLTIVGTTSPVVAGGDSATLLLTTGAPLGATSFFTVAENYTIDDGEIVIDNPIEATINAGGEGQRVIISRIRGMVVGGDMYSSGDLPINMMAVRVVVDSGEGSTPSHYYLPVSTSPGQGFDVQMTSVPLYISPVGTGAYLYCDPSISHEEGNGLTPFQNDSRIRLRFEISGYVA